MNGVTPAAPDRRAIRKFNPGTMQSDEEVIQQYVVREHELHIVLEVLSENVDSPSCQHILLVAPRGRGKTMLLARVAAELRTDGELSEHLLPVRFMEESPEIFDISDFWMEALFHLAGECTRLESDLAQELRAMHRDLMARHRTNTRGRHARSIVLNASDRLGKKLVLMVENMQSLCNDVEKDFGWKLREDLQSEPQIVLLGTATSRFKGLDDANQPFFELFRSLELAPLTTEECQRLWQAVSGNAASRHAIRPLEILTGGSPRLLVIIAEFAQHHSLRRLMEELVRLIDEHTEYFRSHLEMLPKTERRVYVAVTDLWQPSTSGEIAARSSLDIRTVSTMLGRLVNRGAVIAEGSGRRRRYAAAERLYSIYYKLRRERDEAAVVHNLVRFMVVFYTDVELAELTQGLKEEAARSAPIREGIRRALKELPQDDTSTISGQPIIQHLTDLVAASEEVQSQQHSTRSETEEAIESARKLLISVESGELSDPPAAISACDELFKRFERNDSAALRAEAARALRLKGIAQGRFGELATAISTFNAVVERFGSDGAPEVQAQVALALLTGGIHHLVAGEVEALASKCDEVIKRFGISDAPETRPQIALSLMYKGTVHWVLGKFREVTAVCDEVIALLGNMDGEEFQALVASALAVKATMQGALDDVEGAVATCDELARRFEHNDAREIRALVAVMSTFRRAAEGILKKPEVAIAVCDILAEFFHDNDAGNLQMIFTVASTTYQSAQRHLSEPKAFVEPWGEALELFRASDVPERHTLVATILLVKGTIQGRIGQFEGAIATTDELVHRFGDSEVLTVQGLVAAALVQKGESAAEIGRVIEASEICEELDCRLMALKDRQKPLLEWQTGLLRAQVLLTQGQHTAAMDALQSAYAAFIPHDQRMIQQALARIPILIQAGAPERDLIEVLTSDEEKCGVLLPLVVALRGRIGEAVRAPAEVIEVAADIRERIEARLEHYRSVGK